MQPYYSYLRSVLVGFDVCDDKIPYCIDVSIKLEPHVHYIGRSLDMNIYYDLTLMNIKATITILILSAFQ